MADSEDKDIRYGPWPGGMNNRQPDYALPKETARNIINTDIDQAGFLRRRDGFGKVYAGLGTRSGFSCPIGRFFVEGTKLKQFNDDNTATTLFDGILGDYVCYEYFNSEVYFSDGIITGKITLDGVVPWGLDVPPTPIISPISGVFGAGTYLAALTRLDADGREGGASEVVSISTLGTTGIRFSNLPSTTPLRLYLSTPNGETLYAVGDVPAGTDTYSLVTGRYDEGKILDTQFMVKPPPGQIIRHHKGHMYIAQGNLLWYTEPYAFDRVSLLHGYFQLTAPITVVESVQNGLWAVAEKTYLYRDPIRVAYQEGSPAGPKAMVSEVKLQYGAVLGTSQKVPNTGHVMWYSERGMVMGSDTGDAVQMLQEKNVATESGSVGASLLRNKDGIQQMIVSIKDPQVSSLVNRDFLEMEVIRKAAQ